MQETVSNPRNLWQIRDVDEETKRRVKAYAAQKGLSIAEALSEMTKKALSQ